MIDLHPDAIDAMVSAGCTPAMIAAICRACWREFVAVATNATTGVSCVAPVRAMTGTERSRKHRATKRIEKSIAIATNFDGATCNVASVAPPLSLRDSLDSSRERESRAQRSATAGVASVASATTLPANWQPNEATRQVAVDGLGEIGADNCFAKFRDYHEDSRKVSTAAGWQAKARTWARREIEYISARRLPLVASATNGAYATRNVAAVASVASVTIDDAWAPIWARLKADLGEAVAASWFAAASLIKVEEGAATIELPSKFIRHHVETHFDKPALRAVQFVHPHVTAVRFTMAQQSASA